MKLRLLVLFQIVCVAWNSFAEKPIVDGPATRVHFLLVADIEATNIGKSTVRDVERFESLIRGYFEDENHPERRSQFTLTKMGFSGTVSPQDVIAYYKAVQMVSSVNEAIVFYYSGHGDSNARGGQNFTMSGGVLPRPDFRLALEGLGVKSLIILSDACSPESRETLARTQPKSFTGDYLNRKAPAMALSEEQQFIFHDLFVRGQGTVDINSSSYGEYSWSSENLGGLFTRRLFDLILNSELEKLDSNSDEFLSWEEFFPRLKRDVSDYFQTMKESAPDDAPIKESKAQTPYAFTYPSYRDLAGSVAGSPLQPGVLQLVSYSQAYDYRVSGFTGHLVMFQLVTSQPVAKIEALDVAIRFRQQDGTFLPSTAVSPAFKAVDGTVAAYATIVILGKNFNRGTFFVPNLAIFPNPLPNGTQVTLTPVLQIFTRGPLRLIAQHDLRDIVFVQNDP